MNQFTIRFCRLTVEIFLLYFLTYRLSEIENDLKEQRSEKLQEWKNAVTPLQEWLSKEEQKLESQESLAPDMINLRRQKQEGLVCLVLTHV